MIHTSSRVSEDLHFLSSPSVRSELLESDGEADLVSVFTAETYNKLRCSTEKNPVYKTKPVLHLVLFQSGIFFLPMTSRNLKHLRRRSICACNRVSLKYVKLWQTHLRTCGAAALVIFDSFPEEGSCREDAAERSSSEHPGAVTNREGRGGLCLHTGEVVFIGVKCYS